MRGKEALVCIVLFMIALTISLAGCSRGSRPSDAEALKAIEDSGILKGKSFTVSSPLEVDEWGKQQKDGSWPVNVKMTLIIQMPDGTTSQPKGNKAQFRIYRSTDRAGHAVWKAVLGS